MSLNAYQNLKLSNKPWQCCVCINITRRRGDNTNTPVRKPNTLDESVMSCDVTMNQSEMECSVSAENHTISLQQFGVLLDSRLQRFKADFFSDIKASIRSEIHLAITALKDEFTVTVDFLEEGQKRINGTLAAAVERVSELECKKNKLQGDIYELERRLKISEKTSRSMNIEIQAVPEKRSENVVGIFKKICDVINFPISDTEIHACRRVAKINSSSNRPRNILVTLPSPRHRDNILSAVRKFNKDNPKQTLSTFHLGYSGETKKMYLVEHLSPECKELHSLARRFVKDKAYKFVWVKYGQIYIRKDEQSSAVLVKNAEMLKRLL
ncbi:uncharacterized protein LOC128201770 [Galleria mellonella]|uniref:Uncharacterized protein LOC128201770 n=1 Tax=Galleria mellonella TaxID=7137 RepID=A0ABM3MWC4_GALME|nr:uncharacterized protein LOC128201770 [Galleria mellonella]